MVIVCTCLGLEQQQAVAAGLGVFVWLVCARVVGFGAGQGVCWVVIVGGSVLHSTLQCRRGLVRGIPAVPGISEAGCRSGDTLSSGMALCLVSPWGC